MRTLQLVAVASILMLGGAPMASQTAPRVVVRMRPYRVPIVLDTLAKVSEVPGPLGDALHAAAEAFKTLKIKGVKVDTAAHVVANLKFVKTGRLAGVQLSQIVNCGMGITGQNADNDRVTLAIAVLFDPLGEQRTRMGIALTGSSVSMTGNSTQPSACLTTGLLETKLGEIIRNRLLAGSNGP